ncbi:sensor histidine kinase [Brevibacillus dissolubilis]|uniref:sensor histidine kinase n=1 Tax=Brevibacillus dissolubilis TaxID=1844116 RepID=UPI00111623B5|nr:HAMP domain-containing sensor histidine kinase [Brevibacillus dissolubilis]
MSGLQGRMLRSFGFILVLVVVLLEVAFLWTVRLYYYGSAKQFLIQRAETATAFYNQYLPGYELKEKAESILENLSQNEVAKIEIIDYQGFVLLDSYGFSGTTRVTTPDVAIALRGNTGFWQGYDDKTQEQLMAASLPLKDMDRTLGVLRYVISVEPLREEVWSISLTAIGIGAIVILFSLGLSAVFAYRIIQPIKELTEMTSLLPNGNFSYRATKRYQDEVGTLADTFNRMLERLGEHEKLKNDFISSISHELRTPLTSIKGWSETLLTGDMDNHEELNQGLTVITNETNRLAALVEELLDFSKIQGGEMNLHITEFDMAELLQFTYQQFSQQARQKGIALSLTTDSAILMEGDAHRIKQILVNLLDNALKFTSAQGQVDITGSNEDAYVSICIRDTGEGIAEEELPRITEKFYKGSSQQSGSGLGLAICQEIVARHHGKMVIESRIGEGTKITLLLPKFFLRGKGIGI